MRCEICWREIPAGGRCRTERDRFGNEYHVCGRCTVLRLVALAVFVVSVVWTLCVLIAR